MHMNWPITIFLADNNHFNVSRVLRLCSFEMLDLTCLNRTIKHCKGNSWKYWHLLLLSGPEGGSADCVESRLCLSNKWTWKGTRKKKSPQEKWLVFSHGQFCMTPLRHKRILKQAVYCTMKWCVPTVSVASCSFTQMAASDGCRNYSLRFRFFWGRVISHERVLNCKQCSYITYEYTYYGTHGGVTWGTSVPCCMSDSVVFPAALLAYLWGPLEGSL